MYKTVYETAEAVDIIKKSRFIGHVKPITSVEQAQEFIETIKKKYWDASHNVPVYVLGDKFQVQKYSDDGEPSGTAGVPILNILKNENITDVVIVVTRYFGGVKLGTGGLVRAYSQSAKSALEAGKIIEMVTYTQQSIDLDYTLHGKMQNFMMQNDDYILEDTLYTDHVKMIVNIKNEDVESFNNRVIDLTNDQCTIKEIAEKVLPMSNGEWIR